MGVCEIHKNMLNETCEVNFVVIVTRIIDLITALRSYRCQRKSIREQTVKKLNIFYFICCETDRTFIERSYDKVNDQLI